MPAVYLFFVILPTVAEEEEGGKKYWTHHAQKYVNDVSNFFIYDLGQFDF